MYKAADSFWAICCFLAEIAEKFAQFVQLNFLMLHYKKNLANDEFLKKRGMKEGKKETMNVMKPLRRKGKRKTLPSKAA